LWLNVGENKPPRTPRTRRKNRQNDSSVERVGWGDPVEFLLPFDLVAQQQAAEESGGSKFRSMVRFHRCSDPGFLPALEKLQWRSQIVTSNRRARMGLRRRPFAFTEQGVAMLSSVLRSERAVLVNVEIIRAFVRLRQILASHADLARKLEALEKKYDAQFRVVFDAIRKLMAPPVEEKRGKIGFGREHEQ